MTQIRLENITTCLNAAVTTVEVVSKELNTPFLAPIVSTMWSLLSTVQVYFSHSGTLKLTNTHKKIKKNKDACTEMLEQIHQLLYGIIQVHITSNTGGELTPKMLNNLGQFAEQVYHSDSVVGIEHFIGHCTRLTLLLKPSRKKSDSKCSSVKAK
jgi:hypothetical protein